MHKAYQNPAALSNLKTNGKNKPSRRSNTADPNQLTLFIGVEVIDGSGWFQQRIVTGSGWSPETDAQFHSVGGAK